MSFTADIEHIVAENRNGLLGAHPSWKRVRLKEVATILNGYPFESSRFSKTEGTPLIRIRDIIPGQTETYYRGEYDSAFLVQPGEIVVGMDGDFNCAPWAGGPALLNQRVCKITPDETRCAKQFLRYVLPGYLGAINETTPSVTVKHLSSRTVADIPLPLPSLKEQRRIVAEIEKQFSRLEEGVGALRRVQANLKRFRAAVLKAACEGQLVKTEVWPVKTVRDVTSIVTKGSSPNWQGFDYCENGIVFVRSQNVGWGKLDLSDVAHLPSSFNDKERKSVLKTNDVLLNIVGASIGRAAVATSEIEGGNINQAVAVIRCLQDKMRPEFMMAYLISPATQSMIHSQKVDVARANFSLEDIKQLPIPVPTLAEQSRIVAEMERRLSVVEGLEAAVEANLQRATRLRQSILQKAFSGKMATKS